MTNELSVEEAINYFKRSYASGDTDDERQHNEALDMAIQALEKNIEKEPVQTHTRYGMGNEYHDFYCPSCDALLAPESKGLRWKQEGGWSRCSSCFQKIKWEAKNDE